MENEGVFVRSRILKIIVVIGIFGIFALATYVDF